MLTRPGNWHSDCFFAAPMIDMLLYALPSVLDHVSRAKHKSELDASAGLQEQVRQLASAVEHIATSDEEQAQIIGAICEELQRLSPTGVQRLQRWIYCSIVVSILSLLGCGAMALRLCGHI